MTHKQTRDSVINWFLNIDFYKFLFYKKNDIFIFVMEECVFVHKVHRF